jgi:hypothetical protein
MMPSPEKASQKMILAARGFADLRDRAEFDALVEGYRKDQHSELAATYYAFVDLYGEKLWQELSCRTVRRLFP